MASMSSNINCNNNKSNSGSHCCEEEEEEDLTLELLSTCMDAVQHGCAIIRRVQQEGSLKVSYKDDSDSRSAVTRADVEAQSFIIDSITNYWQTRKGEIPNIIGEEEEQQQQDASSRATTNTSCIRLRGNLVHQDSFYSPLETQPLLPSIQSLSQVTLYVDPLDGTREFVEGRYENVSCLIGISIHGRPVAGVIGLPFATKTKTEDDVHVVYGLVGRGIGYCTATYNGLEQTIIERTCGQPGIPPSYIHEQRTNNACLMTGDSFDRSPLLLNMLAVARAELEKDDVTIQHAIVGGAGKKMLLCAYASCCSTSSSNNHRVQFSFKKQSTYLWDTCAPEAILHAVGGKVTDAFGSPLVYNTNKLFTKNSLGVIASCSHGRKYHDAICRTLVSMKETSSTSLL